MARSSDSRAVMFALLLTLLGSIFSTVLNFQPAYASHNIILDEIDEEYRAGDDVTISGQIDNVDDNEDEVTITIDGPESETDSVTLDNDEFDWEYSIPDGAGDGVYIVEVEYDSESVFTYFFIDDNSDLIVETDSATYELGGNVEVFGEVDNPDLGVEDVEITVFDPNGEFVDGMDEKAVDLDDAEFSDDFDLDDNEDAHGRYAVLVTYNNDDEEEGYFIFEVEEDGSSGGGNTISATLSKSTYEPGDRVVITGSVDESDVDLDQVLVSVENPSGDEIFDDEMQPETDGTFDFDFDLDDDAPEGQYKVTLEYIEDYDDKILTFTVSEGTTNGGTTGNGSGSSEGLTAKLNKVKYLAGETMTITGVVPTIEEDELVSIGIFAPDGVFTGSAAYPEPESDKSYSASLRLKSSLEADEDYEAVITYDNKEVTISFDITGTSSEGPLTVRTDKTSYTSGGTVEIAGEVSFDELGEGRQVLLRVVNPDGDVYRYDPVTPSSDGSYSYEMVVGGNLGVSGEWEVTAFYNQEEAETSFALSGGATPGTKPKFNLEVNDMTYPIEYEVVSGTIQIEEMVINYNKTKLVILVEADQDGELRIVLPREVIDAVGANGTDVKYIVTTRDNAVGDDIVVEVTESQTDGAKRTLVIKYEAGTDVIEIQGTTIVPEFGPLSSIILAVAIVGIIAATARFSGKFSMFKQW